MLSATLFLALLIAPGQAQLRVNVTPDEIVARHIEARGGIEKIKAISTLRFEGTRTRAGGGFEMAFVEIRKRPGSRAASSR